MEAFISLIIFVGVIILVIVLVNNESIKKQKRLNDARSAYFSSLNQLKRTPTNPDLRQRTLELGRSYSNLTREQKGVTIFDEVALSNDIGAACAAAAVPTPIPQPLPVAISSIEERLRVLEQLRSQSLVTDEEYTDRRSRILNEI